MNQPIKYPKIGQFRNVISDVNFAFDTFKETNRNIHFKGTVKLHGTNASVCYDSRYGIYAQSRNRVLSITKDNAGFADFVDKEKRALQILFARVILMNRINPKDEIITIYGEWVGEGIQRGVSISKIKRSFIIFDIKISSKIGEASRWLDITNIQTPKLSRVFNITDFQNYNIVIDFSKPEECVNKLIHITREVEKECPVAREFGHFGMGEGVVWKGIYRDNIFLFKVKGEKHSVSKVKTLAPINPEKIKDIRAFVDYAVTKNRLLQAKREVFGKNVINERGLGELIRWVMRDISEEEGDVLSKNNFTLKDVSKHISAKIVSEFFKELNKVKIKAHV